MKYSIYLLLIIGSLSFTVRDSDSYSYTFDEITPDSEEIKAAYKSILSGMSSKKWRANSFTIAGITQQCRLDDQFEFHANGTYTYFGGENLCGNSPSDLSKSGTWIINGADRSITFDHGTEYEYTANIVAALNGSLELKGTYYLLPIRGKYSN